MRVALYGKGLGLTDALRGYVAEKLRKLDRYFPEAPDLVAQVVLSVQRQRHTVEVTLPLEGWILRAEESAPSMYAAVDLVVDKLERQVHKYKTRLVRRPRHDATLAEPAGSPLPVAALPGDEGDAVVRRKSLPLKPMTLEEARLQMELLGHDFFVYRDAGAGGVCVLYRRAGGGLGLLETR